MTKKYPSQNQNKPLTIFLVNFQKIITPSPLPIPMVSLVPIITRLPQTKNLQMFKYWTYIKITYINKNILHS